jgi:DNA transposition AAA+ family ATPase
MADHPMPGYWMHETSGVLRPAVAAYLSGGDRTAEQIAAMRAYLRQWIMAPVWRGSEVPVLRRLIDTLTSRAAIARWLELAEGAGVDPL